MGVSEAGPDCAGANRSIRHQPALAPIPIPVAIKMWHLALVLLATSCGARELDPAHCESRFDIQEDRIIRTEESRTLGALYLTELDVISRDHCVRLCCETEHCDVFVFEEKNGGSCYMFACGAGEEFKCKFSRHGNFTVGVLMLGRRGAELEDAASLAKHEHDLASLRKSVMMPITSTPSRTPAVILTTALPSKVAAVLEPSSIKESVRSQAAVSVAMVPLVRSDSISGSSSGGSGGGNVEARRCSRYQFECHRSGECIAIYNACDGIPQCADGSDEAAELGCPTPPPAPARLPSPQLSPAQSPQLPPAQPFMPHTMVKPQPQANPYADNGASSHIFSHKGGLLQEAEANPAQQYMSWESLGEPAWRHQWPQRQPVQTQHQPDQASLGGYGLSWRNPPEPERMWPVPQPQRTQVMNYIGAETMPEAPLEYGGGRGSPRDEPKKGARAELEPPQAKPPAPPAPTAAVITAAPPTEKKKVVSQPSSSSSSDKAEKAERASSMQSVGNTSGSAGGSSEHHHLQLLQEEQHDGLSERPPGAMALLIVGMLMMGVMGVMLGCRARAVRRRLRRGKSPFAHDSDYLVNGMYL